MFKLSVLSTPCTNPAAIHRAVSRAERATTAKGQHPFAAILTCADSRLSPELIFDQTIGDLFVVRNAGNVAEPVGEGSLEYAIEHLGVRLVIVTSGTGASTGFGIAERVVADLLGLNTETKT